MTGSRGAPRDFGARFALPILLGPALNPINTTMVSVALVPIAEATGTTAAQAVLLVAGLYVASAIAQPTMGRFVDLYGPKRLYLVGMGVAAVAGLIPLLLPTFGAALASRMIIGVGTSAAYPAAMASIRAQSARLRREPPRALFSALSVSSLTSAAIGPVLGGLLVSGFGWEAIFVVNAPYALVAALLALLWLPSDRDRIRPAQPGRRRLGHDLGALAARPALMRTYARVFLVYTCTYVVIYGLTQWVQASAGHSPAATGWMQLPGVLLAGIAAALIGRTHGIWAPMLVAAAIPLAGGIAMTAVGADWPVWALVLVFAVFGPPQGLTAVSNQVAVYAQSPPEQTGLAAGLSRTSVQIGAIAASLAIGAVFGAAPDDGDLHALGWIVAALAAAALTLTAADPALRRLGRAR